MSEGEYLAFLRRTAESVDEMLSGVVKTQTGKTVQVDPDKAKRLFRESVERFRGWWDDYNQAENDIATADLDAHMDEKPNPIDWATPRGRKAFAGDRQLACCCATLCAIHDANKNPCCVDIVGWPMLRGLMYKLICERDQQAMYDGSTVIEALRHVSEHLAHEATTPDAAKPQPSDYAKTERNLDELPDDATLPPKDLAELSGIDYERLRKRLERLRASQDDCFVEVADRKGNEPQFLYKLGSVRDLLREMRDRCSSSRSCPPRK